MTDDREARLPQWAQSLIASLRERVRIGMEPATRELAKLRPRCAKLQAENDALKELLQAAARGGHLTAQEIVTVIQSYAPWKEESTP